MTEEWGRRTVRPMTVDDVRAQLPPSYRRLLTWLDDGLEHGEIASRLGIDPEAVPPLVALAYRKLAALEAVAT